MKPQYALKSLLTMAAIVAVSCTTVAGPAAKPASTPRQAAPSAPAAASAAQPAPAAQPAAPAPAPAAAAPERAPDGLPAELTAALQPLFGVTASYSPPAAPVEGLTDDLDPLTVISLRQLNAWRVAAGLTPYRYDPDLTKLAQAHVRYAMANSQANLRWTGHFETPTQPAYSKEGNEAASTSGLAYGDSDLYEALVSLMSGPFHRLQFLRPEETRIGAGFGSWAGPGNSIGLFVTREPAGRNGSSAETGEPRFVLFPPPGSSGIGVSFNGENPDPRPGFQAMASDDRPATGYPITISLSWDDARAFTSADVAVTDADGHPVPCWVTDPAHPSTTVAPNIYGPGVSAGDAFTRNFNAVFIMPRATLKRGATYSVKARLVIGSKPSDLAWSFTTAPAVSWKVRPAPRSPWSSLAYAVAHAAAGDTIELAGGSYSVADTIRLEGVRLTGAGAGATRLAFEDARVMPFVCTGAAAVEHLSISHGGQIFYEPSGSTLLLRDVSISGGDGESVAAALQRGSTLVLDQADVSGFATYYVCYAEVKGAGGPPRVISRGLRGMRDREQLVYGTAEVQALPDR